MKILIKGYSGSGKSTLGKILSKYYNIPVLHLDSVYWLPNWEHRNDEEFEKIVQDFMNNNDSWIIEGNYTRIAPNRNLEADMTYILNYSRFFCLVSVIKRHYQNKGNVRDDIGLEDKLDFDFIWWILFKGRRKKHRLYIKNMLKNNKNPMMFKTRRKLNKYLKEKGIIKGD